MTKLPNLEMLLYKAGVYLEYDEEFDNALKMGIKKLELLSNEEDNFKKKQKIINYLTYRGFGFDVINDVLKEIL